MTTFPTPGTMFVCSPSSTGQVFLSSTWVVMPNSTSYTAWSEVTASTADAYYLVAVMAASDSNARTGEGPNIFDVGVGAAGAEVVVAQAAFDAAAYSASGYIICGGVFPVNPGVPIASGVRVAVRGKKTANGSSGTPTFTVLLAVAPQSSIEGV